MTSERSFRGCATCSSGRTSGSVVDPNSVNRRRFIKRAVAGAMATTAIGASAQKPPHRPLAPVRGAEPFFPPSIALGTSSLPIPDPGSYRIWSNFGAKTGASATKFDASQGLEWTHLNGDWLDRNGASQGPLPWYSVTIPPRFTGEYRFDATALALRWHGGHNRGAFIDVPETTHAGAWARIAGTQSDTAPQLTLRRADGTITSVVGDLAVFTLCGSTAKTAPTRVDAGVEARLGRQTRILLQFPGLKEATPFTSAEIVLNINASDDVHALHFDVYETDAPPLLMGGGGMFPTMGLAAEVGREDALAGHPDVWAAGDFREMNWNIEPGVYRDASLTAGAFNKPAGLFTSVSMKRTQYDKTEVVPDPDFPGRFALKTCIPSGQVGGGEFLFSLPRRADLTDPRRPMLRQNVVDELFVRVEVCLDRASFWSTVYAFKFSPVGQDLRMGLWDDKSGWNGKGGSAYVFGSGQTKADGKRHFDDRYQQYLYKGHSIRGHMGGWPHPTFAAYKDSIGLGFAPSHLGPYDELWDSGVFGSEQMLHMYVRDGDGRKRQHVIPKGRWVTMESRVKLNSIDLSTVDALGNGVARNDGILQVWLDGVLCGERTNLAWRRHPEMTIKGNWLMQYHGGSTPTDHDIVVWYRNFVVAKRYIGPAIRRGIRRAARP